MNKIFRRSSRKESAQGMVEFALVLPMLLVLLFGIIELGRLFLIYVSVSAASREAARYASAAGENPNTSKDYYEDCAGIREAAKRIGFFAGLQDSDIHIAYDSGPGTAYFTAACSPSSAPPTACFGGTYPSSPPAGTVSLRSRVQVCITSQYQPLLGLVNLQPFTMQATTARTVVKSLAIDEAPPSGTTPVVTIIFPPNDSKFNQGDTVSFTGRAIDAEDGDISADLDWTSSVNGVLQNGAASFSTSVLGIGVHTITAQVEDSSGRIGTAYINIEIVKGFTPPVVAISQPLDGQTFDEGELITFNGTADDNEDGSLTGDLKWTSNIDGEFGAGGTFQISSLGVGLHTITAWVLDSDGMLGSATINIEILPNTPPTVVIDQPLGGDVFAVGDTIFYSGYATDAQDDDATLTANLEWEIVPGFSLGTGAGGSFLTGPATGIGIGTYQIFARVTDTGGLTGEDSVVIQIVENTAPEVQIIAPLDGWFYALGQSIGFRGSAVDTVDGDISSQLKWKSSINGEFQVGASFTYSLLSEGEHTITASVVDSHGNPASVSIKITIIKGTPPTIAITAPANGSIHNLGEIVTFTGVANDAEDGDLSSKIAWESNVDGPLGAAASLPISTLSPGIHTIKAYVFDSTKLYASATIKILINEPPLVTIITPADGANFNEDDVITFTGTANDPEDGDVGISLVWVSDIDGEIGTETTFNTSLTTGLHTIVATATDSNLFTGSASITLQIDPKPCNISPGTYTVSGDTLAWSVVNGATINYRLVKLNVPWNQKNQKLMDVNFGGNNLWSSASGDSTAGSTFGPDVAPLPEHTWDTSRASHVMPPGSRSFEMIFKNAIESKSVLYLLAIFLNEGEDVECSVTISISY